MPRFETPGSHHGLFDADEDQLREMAVAKPFKFVIGPRATEYYAYRQLVSRLSGPLNALVNGGMMEAREGSVTWEDVDDDVFLRFLRFAYIGTYPDFETSVVSPPSAAEEARLLTAKVVEKFMEKTSASSPPAAEKAVHPPIDVKLAHGSRSPPASRVHGEVPVSSDTRPEGDAWPRGGAGEGEGRAADAAGAGAGAGAEPFPPARDDPKAAFRLPYSLCSYRRAATEWFSGGANGHAVWCKKYNGKVVARPGVAKRNRQDTSASVGPCSCNFDARNEGVPSEKKRDFIAAFMAKQGPLLVVAGGAAGQAPILSDELLDDDELQQIWTAKGGLRQRRCKRSFEPVFVGHARVWVFADRYAVASLMDAACTKLVKALSDWVITPDDFVDEFGGLVRYVYDAGRTMAGCQLRLLVAQFAACVVEDVSTLEEWPGLLNDVPDFSGDLIIQMTNRFA